MLPDLTVPPSLMALLAKLGTFTSPSLRTFAALVTGLVAATGKRTVTGMLTAAGLSRTWSHDRAHAFFSRRSWNAEVLGLALSHLLVRSLLTEGAALTVAVDDTLFKRSGKKVFAATGNTTAQPRARTRSGAGPASWWSASLGSCRSAPGQCACQ
jgi:SRSO17 transposase